MPDVRRGLAPAKVNLVLEVTGRREDGYHEIDTVLQTLALADEVTLGHGDDAVVVTGPFAAGTPADRTNLAWRAAAALAERTGRDLAGLQITLNKRIPPAGGLGGGASDAATVLRLLENEWAVAETEVLGAAVSVGSDEPFFVFGGTARATGRGEVVRPLAPLVEHGVVLFIPAETIDRKTARMFAALDGLPFDDGAVSSAFARRGDAPFSSGEVFNAFERVAFDLFEGLARLWEQLEDAVGEPVRLAGAGPALFWIGPPARARAVATAAAHLRCTVVETRTAGSLWRR